MNQKSPTKQKIVFVLMLFALFFVGMLKTQAQTPPGVALFWDKQVGCQVGGTDEKRTIFLEDIADSKCLLVCDQSEVNYELLYLPTGASTTWTVVGGTILTSANDGCTVRWENVGLGSITMNIALPQSTINTTLCIEKIELPTALFKIASQTEPDYFVTCSEQELNFINLSSSNNGSALVNYYWEFGDGATSTEFEPTHTYAHEQEYTVILTVTNACNCKETYKMKVSAKRKGFEIQCPTVVCEGQSAIYSLPFDGAQVCNGNYQWSVVGGQIIAQGNGTAEVLWNQVDELGFGYVTFNPAHCNLPCLEPTTVKVPVIQAKGTIQGPTALCLEEQGRYKLPQWPTTDIQWEIEGNVNNNLAEIILTDQRNEIIVTPLSTGTLILRAVYTNTLLGCSGKAEFTIKVAPLLEIYGEDTFCENGSGLFTNSESAVVTWTLKNEGGTTLQTANAATFNFNGTAVGTYTLTVDAPNFCSIDEKTITVLAKPTAPAALDGDLFICPNAPYTYSVANPDPNYTYTWVVTNGNVIGVAEGNEVNITFNGTFPAYVKVYATTTSPIACTSDPKIITVQQFPVNAFINADNTTVCSSSSALYKAFKVGTTTLFEEGDSYTWSLSDPSMGSVIQGQGTTEVTVLWNEVSSVSNVDLILTIGKCTISPAPQFVKHLQINPKTQIEITALPNPACGEYEVTYTVSSTNILVPLGATDVVTWNLGSGSITTEPGVFTLSKTFYNYTSTNIDVIVSAVIADSNGCGATNTAFFTTTILPNPPAIVSIESGGNTYCDYHDINTILQVSTNTAGVQIQWYHDNAIMTGQNGTSLAIAASPNAFGAYYFIATNPNGCINRSNSIVILEKCGSTWMHCECYCAKYLSFE